MVGPRSFRHRIFLALLIVALVPAGAAVLVGAGAFGQLGSTLGTLGPWDSVAASGGKLIEEVRRVAPEDSLLLRAAEAHGEALSESVRLSRFWAFVSQRALAALPWAALVTSLIVALLAFGTARWLSHGFSRPIQELVGWTERIAQGRPLEKDPQNPGPSEFVTLRAALRRMAGDLEEGRRREVEGARLKAWMEMARRVAHEIKNPLTPMRMAATTIARSEDPEQEQAGEVLLEEIAKLDDMARGFSQFGRMPEGPTAEVDLAELLQAVAEPYQREGIGVELRVEPDVPRIDGHYELLRRAFGNVVLNAVEAVQLAELDQGRTGPMSLSGPDDQVESGEPRESVGILVDRTDVGIRVRILDRGPGIPEAIQESVWLPDVTTKRSGTGLGLAIVRQAVEAHGGHAVARNRQDGRGAHIEIVLPTRPATP